MARQPFNPDLIQPPPDKSSAPRGPLTVSQVTALVKRAIETAIPATIHVVGEISNFKHHSSGHLYLTLKDRHSELSCVMWRSAAGSLKFTPEDGMEVIASGSVEVFERAGRYQLYIRKLEPRGVGALELAFRQLCDKLQKEGLFDDRHKKPLPAFPTRIAVITSPTGAAIGDIMRTIRRRYPCVELLLYPVRVQGDGAAGEIARAIHDLNANAAALDGVDVMIVGRGGGSLEDLWAFNEEIVARAIHAGRIPIISAVGHEVDLTVADLTADVRAATPTAAAELAVPVRDEVAARFDRFARRLGRAARTGFEVASARLAAVAQHHLLRDPLHLLHRREQVLDELAARSHRTVVSRIHDSRRRLDAAEPIVQRIAPHLFLMRRTVALQERFHRLHCAMADRVAKGRAIVAERTTGFERVAPPQRLTRLVDSCVHWSRRLSAAVDHRLSFCAERIRRQAELLTAMSHRSVLGRGFTLTRTKRGYKLVRSVREIKDGQRVVTEVSDGEFESQVINLRQLELFE